MKLYNVHNTFCITGVPPGYEGCYRQVPNGNNDAFPTNIDLPHLMMSRGATIDVCIAECADSGFLYAGLSVIIIVITSIIVIIIINSIVFIK